MRKCNNVLLNFAALGKPQAVLPETNESDITEDSSADGGSKSKKKGMILPFEPHCITFDDIKYSVDMPRVSKLNSIVALVCFN